MSVRLHFRTDPSIFSVCASVTARASRHQSVYQASIMREVLLFLQLIGNHGSRVATAENPLHRWSPVPSCLFATGIYMKHVGALLQRASTCRRSSRARARSVTISLRSDRNALKAFRRVRTLMGKCFLNFDFRYFRCFFFFSLVLGKIIARNHLSSSACLLILRSISSIVQATCCASPAQVLIFLDSARGGTPILFHCCSLLSRFTHAHEWVTLLRRLFPPALSIFHPDSILKHQIKWRCI